MSAPTSTDPELEHVAWDLSHLLAGSTQYDPAAAIDATLAGAQQAADAFAERYRGRVAELDGPGLAEAMHEVEAIEEAVGRVYSYAGLDFATNTADPKRGALMQRVQELATAIQTRLVFWDLEWAAVDDARADELLAHDELDFCRHHLLQARRYRPHLLSEPEEKVHAEKALTARSAWQRLYAEQASAIKVDLDEDEPASIELALSRLHDGDREVRRHAAERITTAL